MEILSLLLISSMPVIKVLLVTGLGAFLATKKIDILGAEARKHLNKVVFYVFNPALVSTNLSKTITLESMMLLWFMPVNILFTFLIGLFLGWILVKSVKPPLKLRGIVLGCCSAGNLGNLLLIIVPAICREKGSPFGDPSVCERYGLSYASLSMALGAIFLWSIAYNIMRISFANCTIREPNGGPKSPTRLYDENQNIVSPNNAETLLALDRTSEELPEKLSERLLLFEDCADKKIMLLHKIMHWPTRSWASTGHQIKIQLL